MPEQQAKLTYLEAVNAALHRALSEMPETLFYGEDVAKPGGVFGASKGLHQKFGSRVFDTPISESAILGAAVGAALMGRRPVVEIMWVDFTLVGLDQLVNQAANVRYLSRGKQTAPITVRTQQGALPGSCAQHSQCLEALFAHIPGLLVAVPSCAQDAYDILLTAIAADDPVIVIESRQLYAGPKEDVRIGGPIQPIGGGRNLHEGTDVTVIAWGTMAPAAVASAEQVAHAGISVEVIDARWLSPLDTELVLSSVRKTSRLVIAHEANVSGGFGAEVAARVAEHAVHALDAPILRVGAPDVRIPAAPALQRAVIPGVAELSHAIKTVAGH